MRSRSHCVHTAKLRDGALPNKTRSTTWHVPPSKQRPQRLEEHSRFTPMPSTRPSRCQQIFLHASREIHNFIFRKKPKSPKLSILGEEATMWNHSRLKSRKKRGRSSRKLKTLVE